MVDPNSMQVGGNHYKSTFEHWDLVIAVSMGYMEGNATRYVARWRKKGGVEDLKKALHYVEKLLSVARLVAPYRGSSFLSTDWITAEVNKFGEANSLLPNEWLVIKKLAVWSTYEELTSVKIILEDMINRAEVRPVPLI